MLKSDINKVTLLKYLKQMLSLFQYNYYYKIHSLLNVTVPLKWEIKDRRNVDLHILFVKGGKGSYFINHREEPLHRGKIIFASNNCLHSSNGDKNDLPQIIPIRFGIYSTQTLEMVDLFETPFYFSLELDNVLSFEKKFEQLYKEYSNEGIHFNEALCNALLTQIWIELFNLI
jgi:hypothetical protein